MHISDIKSLIFPEIKIIKFKRFYDERGYFSETYRYSDFENIDFLKNVKFTQCNQVFSKAMVIRGFHIQWEPPMAKMVRVLKGNLIDFMLDLKKSSPNFGKIIAYQSVYNDQNTDDEWIYIPFGFGHGTLLLEDSLIEYFCTGHYNPDTETGVSPLAEDIDFSLCDTDLKNIFMNNKHKLIMSQRDKNAMTIDNWLNSIHFKKVN